MDGIMTKVAYKVANGLPNLPNGFIIEHFETQQDAVEGYVVTTLESFSALLANNGPLLQAYEIQQNEILTARLNANAKVLVSKSVKKEISDEDEALFKEFLAWKAAQGNNS